MFKHILSGDQFSVAEINKIFIRAGEIKKLLVTAKGRQQLHQAHQSRQIATLFYQPSTRTRLSFETAALKLGVGVVSTEAANVFSSAAKGETIEDTVRVLNRYQLDAIIIRYHEVGGAKRAAAVSSVPIINAGDGPGEHPTQALLDAFTILQNHRRLDNLKIVVGGDLKHGRTMRSLSLLLSKYPNNHFTYISIPELQVGEDIKKTLRKNQTSFDETADMKKAFADADVIYWTRIQKEYIENPQKLPKGGFNITSEHLKFMPKSAIIMHPLPRVDEISTEVDSDPRAKYFEQAGNGLYVRMALIDMILSNG